jgi:small-conductance mechanosensitive channel
MIRAFTRWIYGPGPVVVRVGVSYRSDPDKVRSALESAARDCPLVRPLPVPTVTFDNFGPSALEFSLRAICIPRAEPDAAATDLRTRILKAFRGAGIEMPFAQHDIHLRDLDAVRVILNRVAEERTARPGVNGEREDPSMSEASAAAQSRRRP